MSVASGMVKLPVNYGYIGLSIVAVAVLLAWTGGYVLGGSSAEERARREIESATGGAGLVDPLTDAGGTRDAGQLGQTPARGTEPRPGNPEPRRVEPAGGGTPSNAGGAAVPVITQQRTRYLAAGGFFDREPRSAGLNYFCLVSRLPEVDTVSALEFLARNGVRAVGVERASSDANNRSFELYTLEGLSRDEYAGESGTDKRATHEALVAELGRRWRAEERGTSDFARPQWYRYNP